MIDFNVMRVSLSTLCAFTRRRNAKFRFDLLHCSNTPAQLERRPERLILLIRRLPRYALPVADISNIALPQYYRMPPSGIKQQHSED